METWTGLSPQPVVVDAICTAKQQRQQACPREGLRDVCIMDKLEALATCTDGFDDGTLITR